MPLTKPSKWVKRTKKTEEMNADIGRAEFWDSLMFPKHNKSKNQRELEKKKKKAKYKAQREQKKAKKLSLRRLAYDMADERDNKCCVLCGRPVNEHHHIIPRGTRLPPELIERVENVANICSWEHTLDPKKACHLPDGGHGENQLILEQWQAENYPEYVEEVRIHLKNIGKTILQLIQEEERERA